MTTHYEKIQALGNRMASNLETMGVSASFSDGGLTLADKILEIQQFTDGLLLWADKDIIQTGDTVNFCALLLEDKKAVSGETVFFYDLNNPPITRSSTQTHTLNVELGSSFKLIYQSSSTYGERIMLSNEDNSLLIQYSGYNNNVYISINGGIPVTAFSCEGFLKLENEVLSDDGGHTYNLSSYNLNFKLKEMQTVGNNCSVYINPIGSAVTGANGVATVSYTGVGAGNLNVQAKTIDGSSQSETYEIIDGIFYDDGVTSPKTVNWYKATNTLEVSIDNTGTLLSCTEATNYYANSTSSINRFIESDFAVEFDVVEFTGQFGVRIRTTSNTDINLGNVASAGSHILIQFKDNVLTYTIDDGTPQVVSQSITGNIGVSIRLGTGTNSIRYKNFVIYPLYDDVPTTLTVSANNPTITTGETSTLTVTAKGENNYPVKNISIDLYDGENKLTTIRTDNTGKATYTYTGVGNGLHSFQAKYSTLQSEIFAIWDTLFYDSGLDDGTKNPNWTSSGNPTITPTSTGTIVSNTASSLYTSSATLTGDFEAILYVSDIVRGVRVGLNSSNGSTRSTIYNTGYVKIQRVSNVPKIYFSSDGTNWTETTYDLNTLTSADCNFFFFLYTSSGNEVAIKYKDLKIYKI